MEPEEPNETEGPHYGHIFGLLLITGLLNSGVLIGVRVTRFAFGTLAWSWGTLVALSARGTNARPYGTPMV